MLHDYIAILCLNCGKKINVPVYCGNRFCTVCSGPRLSRIRKRITWLIGQVRVSKGMRLKHLTLTIPNQPDLPIMLKHLLKSFRKLRSTPFWKNHVNGGAFVIEVTGKADSWHGHLHMVIDATYLDWEKLKNLWIRFSSGRGVWISVIPGSQAVRYLTKYLTKPDVPDCDLSEINKSLKGFRLFQPFGSWYSVSGKYKPPKSKCSSCGAIGQFDLYYEYFGGSIRIAMTESEAKADSRGSPVSKTPSDLSGASLMSDVLFAAECPF